jgi:serine/threonine protein kinase
MKVLHIPCGPFANESERLACEKLKSKLQGLAGEGLYIILSNILFNFQVQGLSDEIDLLIISPSGVTVIEVKHWDINYLKENPPIIEAEAEKLNNKAKKIASKVRIKYDVGFIEGRILLTKGDLRLLKDNALNKVKGIRFYGMLDWQDLLGIGAAEVCDNYKIESICRLLEPRTKIALNGDMRTFSGLTNLELMSPPNERFHRVYKGIHISRRDRVILNLFDLSASNEKNALEIAKREYETLQRLQKSPFLPRLLDSFQDAPEYPGELYFYSIVEPAVPTVEERSSDLTWAYEQRLSTAINCIQALLRLHEPEDSETPPILHRNLTPSSIRIKANGQPLFTDLNLTKLPGITISPYSVTFAGREKFVAPEILKSGIAVADNRSDIYSLCKSLSILFEKMGDIGLSALDLLKGGSSESPDDRSTLAGLNDSFKALLSDSTTQTNREEMVSPSVNAWDEETVITFQNQSYKIINKLGTGGIGTTFKVVHIDNRDNSEYGSYVAKVIFDDENGDSALRAYRKVRPYSVHPHLAAIHEISSEWEKNNFVALMKWVEGVPLSDLAGVLSLYANDLGELLFESLVLRWLTDLCAALGSLHRVGLVHGDVTPKNIIVSGGDVTLTDYDAVADIGSRPRIYTVLYCSSSVQNNQPITPSDDIFALAATFFHVLYDKEPFRFGVEIRKDKGFNYQDVDAVDLPIVTAFFDKAANPDYTQRFKSGLEALQFLNNVSTADRAANEVPQIPVTQNAQSLTPNEVPRLLDILRSYPGSLKGNDETRGLDSAFAELTYVETNLDKILFQEINEGKVRLAILFGNAGDGKTAFLQHLAMRLGLQKRCSSERLWDHTLQNGQRIRANLDGSAAYQGKSASELLDDFFAPFQNCTPPDNLVHLLAINSGPLQAWILDYERRNGETLLTTQLQAVLEGDTKQLDKKFRLLDLNNRSLVGGIVDGSRAISTDFLDNLLNNLIGDGNDDLWEPCLTCKANNYCSAWESVQLLRDKVKGLIVRNRLYLALQSVHQRGEIHITARELRAALSYIFFGSFYCTDLHANGDLKPGHYYERAFDPESPHRQGEVLEELIFLDPSLEAHPKVDRYLLGHKDSQSYFSSPQYHWLSLASARRKAYFEWTNDDFKRIILDNGYFGLAHCRHIEDFRKLPLMTDDEKKQLCSDLCKGIAKLEDLPPVAFKYSGIPLRITPRTPTESALWVVKPFNRFSLHAKFNATTEGLERLHTHLELKYKYVDGTFEKLVLGAELFNILMELKDGVQLSDAASEDTFANLSIFTQRLTQEDSRQFFAWNPIEEEAIYGIDVINNSGVQTITCLSVSKESLR